METTANLKKVALIFFIILGLIHIISGLMIGNGYLLPTSATINRILDIPFAISALIYGLSSISCNIKEGQNSLINTIFIIITLLIFSGLAYINIFIPDKVIN